MRRATIAGLSIYPVKSCRGADIRQVHVLPTGLAHDGIRDREWMVVDPRGRFVTQREVPDLALVRALVRDARLELLVP
ncbi:MOSC N-terminal beta barrel domain-containing protein, partial [Sulfuricurvum sp.]|uniref:MOSC N-terminal beta barrel domain-containing protein n=1 Tax=Sulfuricurvum sp. TaxID=2025608 RepID=UPI003C345E33